MSSLANIFGSSGGGGVGNVKTLTGNDAIAVGPNGSGNINVEGDGTTLNITGNAGTNTLTAAVYGGTTGQILTSNGMTSDATWQNAPSSGLTFDTDSGSATPLAGVITIESNNAALNAGSSVLFTGAGSSVVLHVTDINENTMIGQSSGNLSMTGLANTALGYQCLSNLTSGRINTAIGASAGSAYTSSEAANIVIGSAGIAGDSHVIRIGTNGSGPTQQNACYIAGIDGVNVGSVATVVTESGNQLGTAVITAGSGITVTPGANSITIAASGGGGGITTIDVDASGSVTGSTISLFGNSGSANPGSTIQFLASSGTEIDLQSYDTNRNIITGSSAGNNAVVGNGGADNIGFGTQVLFALTSGINNVAIGNTALTTLDAGSNNIGIGLNAIQHVGGGSNNVGIGSGAGSGWGATRSNNIAINANGSGADVSILRIGQATGTGTNQLNAAFICGINGATSSSGIAVLVNSSNQLGTTTSSREFKNNIEDMGTQSSSIFNLRPVIFNYKQSSPHVSEEDAALKQYGLIAEEVFDVMPDLVSYNSVGKIESVRYLNLIPMLLNELQKASKRIGILEDKLNVK